MISPELKRRIEDKILDSLLRAQTRFNRTFDVPTIIYHHSMGGVAGTAHAGRNEITFSESLLLRHSEEFLNRTVPHEVAHIVCRNVFPRAKQAHGPEWRYVCQVLGMSDLKRCHSYDTAGLIQRRAPRAKQFALRCKCGEHKVTITIYKRFLTGTKYRCAKCKYTLYAWQYREKV